MLENKLYIKKSLFTYQNGKNKKYLRTCSVERLGKTQVSNKRNQLNQLDYAIEYHIAIKNLTEKNKIFKNPG